MPDLYTLLQLGLSAILLGVIAERLYYLRYAAPLSESGLAFVMRALAQERHEALRAFAHGAPRTHVGRLLASLTEVPEQARGEAGLVELSFELTAEALVRLRALRVGATLASTSGLLVGIVRLRGGFARPSGLLALEAGLSERMAVADALFAMAVGVGTSAVCFYALSLLRDAARELIAQRTRVEKALVERLRAGA